MSVLESGQFVDYYTLLQVGPSAEPEQIRAGYLRMAKLHHPDTGGTTEMMQQLTTAYRTLANTTARAAYDMLHSFHTGSTKSQYREVGKNKGDPASGNMPDEYIDFFIDAVFAEYHDVQPQKPKTSLRKRVKKLFRV